ncbi:MAG: GNAT family N-acetyltransferase [Fimbriimonadaceae bacterium]|nr:GNAT family N-acetyltransferase [Fimbriimonadaceae bacterium]
MWQYREFDATRDRSSSQRIWREVGWLTRDETAAMDAFVDAGRALVAHLPEHEPEALVLSAPGSLRYRDADLPLAAVTGVTVGRAGRQQGLAGRLVARLVAADALAGAVVSALYMFEQGFYNRAGFGTGGHEMEYRFDPSKLRVPVRPRPPVRLTPDDWERMHQNRLQRRRRHGAVCLTPPAVSRDSLSDPKCFGLGYADASGRLTHHFAADPGEGESGPLKIHWLAWRSDAELLELLALIGSLEDQYRSVELHEPPGVPLQDFLDRPIRDLIARPSGRFQSGCRAGCFWQMRLNDLPTALAQLRFDGELRCNLQVTDPVVGWLPAESPWRGVAGEWTLQLGATSSLTPGQTAGLPLLTATVNDLTRLWLGVAPASGLALTGGLQAPPDLLAALDEGLRLPPPQPDWAF